MTESDPNLHISLHSTPLNPNPNLEFSLSPSYKQSPRKKRTKTIASSSSSSSLKPKTSRKPDPNAPKITRPCTECGKKFWSLKALFGHMRCHPERQWRGINPPPNHRTLPNWVKFMSKEDLEVASCLLLLSNATPLLSSSCDRFECGGCKKVFGSHQALGGHRASHKNVKGCFAITNINDDDPMMVTTSTSCDQDHQGSYHKCNICFRVFSSGQALGGHMRCHWEKEEERMMITNDDTLGCSLDLRLRL